MSWRELVFRWLLGASVHQLTPDVQHALDNGADESSLTQDHELEAVCRHEGDVLARDLVHAGSHCCCHDAGPQWQLSTRLGVWEEREASEKCQTVHNVSGAELTVKQFADRPRREREELERELFAPRLFHEVKSGRIRMWSK